MIVKNEGSKVHYNLKISTHLNITYRYKELERLQPTVGLCVIMQHDNIAGRQFAE